MRLTVSETSAKTGVSVRTLHYYHEIGLLAPSEVSKSGYRYYDEAALKRLQDILFYRELDFSLKDIADMLSLPGQDRTDTLAHHRALLHLKQKRLARLIGLVDQLLKGDTTMSFEEFDMREIETARRAYAEEAREKWGNTDAYRQSVQKTSHYGAAEWETLTQEANAIFARFYALLQDGVTPDSPSAQELVRAWQNHITTYYYPCTDEILTVLGQMYAIDERFQTTIDRAGAGTALYMSRAIACSTPT